MAGTVLASTIKHDVSGAAPVIRDGAGNEIGRCIRGFVNFNGSTPVLNSSFNASSLTRNGTGDFTVAFSISFSDQYYSLASTGTSSANFITALYDSASAPTSSAVRLTTQTGGFSLNNATYSMFTFSR